jgi:hypothetical protein
MMTPNSIGGVNRLSSYEKREIYMRLIPHRIFQRFQLSPYLVDANGKDLLTLNCPSGSIVVEMALKHQFNFPDPILYGEITDTINGQIHVLLYILNDPESPRFDVDRMQDGTPTGFGTIHRNYSAEVAAMQFGLAPGQIRAGLRTLGLAIQAFEKFVDSLDHQMYFVEPLYYHNAIIFERYGFSYEKGRKLMERIQAGFMPDGDLLALLDGSTPFRSLGAARSIRLRSWAIHDGIMGEPFTNVTMYKRVGKSAGVKTSDDCGW